MDTSVRQLFSDKHLRLTKPRIAVFSALKTAAQPLSIVEIIALCPTADATSVYRTINLLMKLSVVTAVSHGWKQRYELAAPFKPHHHHLHCVSCHSHTELHSKHLETLISAISKENHFTPQQHHFEISGLCEQCQTHPTGPPSDN